MHGPQGNAFLKVDSQDVERPSFPKQNRFLGPSCAETLLHSSPSARVTLPLHQGTQPPWSPPHPGTCPSCLGDPPACSSPPTSYRSELSADICSRVTQPEVTVPLECVLPHVSLPTSFTGRLIYQGQALQTISRHWSPLLAAGRQAFCKADCSHTGHNSSK